MLTKTNVQFPYTLDPGEYFTAYTDDLSMFDDDVRFLAVEDSLGRTYKARSRDVRRIKVRAMRRRR